MNNVQTAGIIKSLCKERSITINALLENCDIRKSLIYDMERRDKTPSPDILERIANYLNCSVDYLLGRDEQKEKPSPTIGGGQEDSELEQEFMSWFRAQTSERQKEVLFDLAKAVNEHGE